ncbi:M15 family metallopeptidase [Granulicoccus phenolivorans]|uniref:M15 family metallopeptidase n=1 Tax=Granulicoccus phenolivorans TaxID=266854 RepID=UPI00040B954D|nr:M15 family metallopeptidase [Granulicoccus phenolivorans]
MKKLRTLAIGGVAAAALTLGVVAAPGLIDTAAAKNYRLSDYGKNPHSSNAEHASWGNKAWPNCPTDIVMATSNTGDRAGVRKALAPLVSALLIRTEAMGYALDPAQTGGFDCRPIRGSDKPSNHSRGLAVDLNWNRNPMGSTFVSDIPPTVVAMWETHGFYWGGRYSSRPDAMHFEYIGSVDSVAQNLATLNSSDKSTPTRSVSPRQPSPTPAKPSSTAKPSTTAKPSSTAKPSITAEPSSTGKPSSTAKTPITAKPSTTAKSTSTARPSTRPTVTIKPTATAKPSTSAGPTGPAEPSTAPTATAHRTGERPTLAAESPVSNPWTPAPSSPVSNQPGPGTAVPDPSRSPSSQSAPADPEPRDRGVDGSDAKGDLPADPPAPAPSGGEIPAKNTGPGGKLARTGH